MDRKELIRRLNCLLRQGPGFLKSVHFVVKGRPIRGVFCGMQAEGNSQFLRVIPVGDGQAMSISLDDLQFIGDPE